jgi:hypothetical protein
MAALAALSQPVAYELMPSRAISKTQKDDGSFAAAPFPRSMAEK